MLVIKDIYKHFDGIKAVDGFSMSLEPNKITGLIGPNGAGKTTVFNIITGFINPDSGTIIYKNNSLSSIASWKISKTGIVRTFQNLRLLKNLTALENVIMSTRKYKEETFLYSFLLFSKRSKFYKDIIAKAESLLDYVGLTSKKNEPAGELSYGQQKLLTIACLLACEPEVLLLDEPVSGVQPAMIEKIISLIKDLVTNKEKTILLIEHNLDFVKKVSDKIIVMDEGKKIAEGGNDLLEKDTSILEAYLS